jgi:hypothetical protein
MRDGQHLSQQTLYGRDLNFWSGFGDIGQVMGDSNLGQYKEWLGRDFPTFASATGNGGWITYQDTGATVGPRVSFPPTVGLTTDGTDEDEVWLQLGNGTDGGLAYFSATAGSNFDQWLEFTFKADRITANAVAYYLGLAAQGGAAANFVADATGVVQTTVGHVGFSSVAATPQTLRGVYVTGSGSLGTPVASAHTLVVDTWTRVGIRYRRRTGNVEYWTGSGTTPMTRAGSVAISTSGFPDGVNMTPIMGFKSLTATATNLDIYAVRYGIRWDARK